MSFVDAVLGRLVRLWLIFVAIYFSMMTSLPLSIDAEVNIALHNNAAWIAQGRWVTYLLAEFILPPPVLPYFTLSVFGVLIAGSYLLMLKACRIDTDIRAYLAFPIFSAFPIWSFILEFAANVVVTGVGMLLCACSLYLLSIAVDNKGRYFPPINVMVQSILLAVAIGTYQAFVFVYITLVIAMLILRNGSLRYGELFRVILISFSSLVLSVILYTIIQKIFLLYFDLTIVYIDSFLRFDLILSEPLFITRTMLSQAYEIYSGSKDVYGTKMPAAGVLVVLGALHLLIVRSWLRSGLYLCLFIAPMGMALLAGGFMPYRALIGTTVVMWVAAILAMTSLVRYFNIIGSVCVILLGFSSVALISQYQAERLLVAEFDRDLAGRIYAKITEVTDLNQLQKLDFYGQQKRPSIYPVGHGSTAGASFFSWDNGNPWRMLLYMKLLGYTNLDLVSNEERLKLTVVFAGMPAWPLQGSVRKYGDTVLIKLSDEPGQYSP